MSKELKDQLVPKLRFPEFKNYGVWEKLPIGDKVDLLSGYPFEGSEISEDSNGTPLMRGINITEGFIRHSKDIDRYFLGDTSQLKKYKLQKDDLVIGMDGSKVGKNSALITDDDSGSLLIQRVARLRVEDNATIKFIFQHINSIIFHNYVDKINTSGGIPHISAKQINEFEICFPKENEQQKIADCLSSLDDLINAENRKLEAFIGHKKGLLQNLFPTEGEKVPKLRFKVFENSGEWLKKSLGQVAEIITGNTPSTNELAYYNGDLMFVSPADIGYRRYITQTKTTLTELGFSKTRHIKANSVLFVCIGSTIGKVAQNKFECATNQQINSLIPFKGYSSEFLYSILENNSSKIASIAGHQAVPIINKTLFSSVEIYFPPTPEEQQRIADCLLSLDEQIETQNLKIETLKLHKKGLMQNLFPNFSGENL